LKPFIFGAPEAGVQCEFHPDNHAYVEKCQNLQVFLAPKWKFDQHQAENLTQRYDELPLMFGSAASDEVDYRP
jgi:hypothetical protein